MDKDWGIKRGFRSRQPSYLTVDCKKLVIRWPIKKSDKKRRDLKKFCAHFLLFYLDLLHVIMKLAISKLVSRYFSLFLCFYGVDAIFLSNFYFANICLEKQTATAGVKNKQFEEEMTACLHFYST